MPLYESCMVAFYRGTLAPWRRTRGSYTTALGDMGGSNSLCSHPSLPLDISLWVTLVLMASSTPLSPQCLSPWYTSHAWSTPHSLHMVNVIRHVMQLSSLIVPVKVLFLYIPRCIVTVMTCGMQLC